MPLLLARRPVSLGQLIATRVLAVLLAAALFGGIGVRFASAGPLVAPTEALTPEEEKAKFKLPPGFEAQLVAAEPDINKPMNLAFDARGRLWVSHSHEYPWAADPAKATDSITILEDFGPDGRARKITKFAENMNIPIGILPLGEGNEAIAWSIPNIWKLKDTDGDGRADKRDVMFGPFDYVDTHGDQNAFRLGFDGWVYANHGFKNDSKVKVKGEGPVVLAMQSGNTYRFRPDGSAIEQVSQGQVNPFGSCWDERGQMYTADCHSRALTMILRGGVYESFGKPHDGLGYAPVITNNDHGSTGLGGITYYTAEQYPAEYRNAFYVCNVVTNRVHRDIPQYHGSSPWIDKPDDFFVSDDWWFHPVDVQVGPDGCLYVADFYNCIIGHYEVDLKHPRRDRTRGRIWRVVWKGLDGKAPPPQNPVDVTKLEVPALAAKMGEANLGERYRAYHEMVRRVRGGAKATDFVALLKSPEQQALVPWASQLLNDSSFEAAVEAVVSSSNPLVRVHVASAMGEKPDWTDKHFEFERKLLADEDPFVRRAAVQALGLHPHSGNIAPLLTTWNKASANDVQLRHAVKIALRNQLRDKTTAEKVATEKLAPAEADLLGEIALAVPSAAAAHVAFSCIQRPDARPDLVGRSISQVVKYADAAKANEVAAFARKSFTNNRNQEVMLFQALLDAPGAKGQTLDPNSEMGRWGAELAAKLLDSSAAAPGSWQNVPLNPKKLTPSPWGIRARNMADGGQGVPVFDSIVQGEHLTGILRSAPFTIPEKLTFWMCGHNGLPGTNGEEKNLIRLKLAGTDDVLASQPPPRNDVAKKFTWNLKKHVGKKGVIEIVDGDTATAFAWIGVGRFDPPVVAQPSEETSLNGGARRVAVLVAEQLKLTALAPRIGPLVASDDEPMEVRLAAAQAVMSLDAAAGVKSLADALASVKAPIALRAKTALLLGQVNSPESRTALTLTLTTAPAALQQALGVGLATHAEGADELLKLIAAGKATPRLLQDKLVGERLANSKLPDYEKRVAELTKNLPPADARVNQLLADRGAGFSKARSGLKAEAGTAVFQKNCAACHKLAGQGAVVGPQLDGIGVRGAERLLEDIIDPNRNVDAAFRTLVINTKEGQVITGLKLREEGGTLILADNQGKEVRVATAEIETSQPSPLSLMPSNHADTISENDLYQLLAYLLEHQTKQ